MKLLLGGHLSFYLPGFPRQLEVQLEVPNRLSGVLENLGIPNGEIYLVVVNGEYVEPHSTLVAQDDEVKIYPPMDGG
jgi:molybdopterin converting factor small subunit